MKDYSNAFAEVYEILNYLEEESYNKIPKDFLEVIEENRNKEYEYIVENPEDLTEQPMLPETRAILFNIFRDYLCTPEQREKILKMQAEERRKNEEKKRIEYYKNKETDKAIKQTEEVKEEKLERKELIIVECQESLWKKIKHMIKKLFA